MRRKKWKFKKLGIFYRSIFETTRLENRCRVSKRKGTRDVDGRMFCTARLIKKYPVSVGLFLSWLALSLSLSLDGFSARGRKIECKKPEVSRSLTQKHDFRTRSIVSWYSITRPLMQTTIPLLLSRLCYSRT